MPAALLLLILQGMLGGFDTLYYHEFRLQLPSVATARKELKLHAVRDFLYTAIFGSLAWITWNGSWAWLLIGLLMAEVFMTLWDFLEKIARGKFPRENEACTRSWDLCTALFWRGSCRKFCVGHDCRVAFPFKITDYLAGC